jgi:GABA(A) receptor-associated protein
MDLRAEMLKTPLGVRREQSTRLMKKYDARIPVIVGRSRASDPEIDKTKYLVEPDMKISQLVLVFRRRIKLRPEQAIYLFINNELINVNSTINEVYHHAQLAKDADGFLYIVYALENTFG